jgi:SAM-dependent methyltransferase
LTTDSETAAFIRYLAAKKRIDDRALSRQVWQELKSHLPAVEGGRALQVLEVGAGIGTMFERCIEWSLFPRFEYTLVEQNPAYLAAFKSRSGAVNKGQSHGITWQGPDAATFNFKNGNGTLETICSDLYALFSNTAYQNRWDLIIAHAVMDLVNIAEVLQGFERLLKPGGLLYLTINYDGLMDFLPAFDVDFDQHIYERYHSSMDQRIIGGRASGSSRAGRLLLSQCLSAGHLLLAVGSSDWVVLPQDHQYPGDEAYFLEMIIQMVNNQLKTDPNLNQTQLKAWKTARLDQILAAELVFIARNVDLLARLPHDGA